MKLLVITLLTLGTAVSALAGIGPAPEVDGNTAVGAVALVSGGLMILRARRKK